MRADNTWFRLAGEAHNQSAERANPRAVMLFTRDQPTRETSRLNRDKLPD